MRKLAASQHAGRAEWINPPYLINNGNSEYIEIDRVSGKYFRENGRELIDIGRYRYPICQKIYKNRLTFLKDAL